MLIFSRHYPIIVALSVIGSLLIEISNVQAQPVCFMITSQHQTIDLDGICRSLPQPKTTKPTSSLDAATTPLDTETDNQDEPEVDPVELRKLQEIAVAPEVFAEEDKLPVVLEGMITKELYEIRPRCQLFIEKMNSNPQPISLERSSELGVPLYQGTIGNPQRGGGLIGICKYRM